MAWKRLRLEGLLKQVCFWPFASFPRARNNQVAFGERRTSTGRQSRLVWSRTQSGHFGTGPTSNSTTAGFRFIVAGEIIHLLRANCISLEGRMIMSAQSSSATDRLLG
jgi:hypothetical protein